MYVSEIREITLRTGPGTEYKIIAMVNSGTPLTVLEEGEKWTRIQLENGNAGWVLNQFLQTKVPDYILLDKLQKVHSSLSNEAETLKDKNRELLVRVENLTSDLHQTQKELEALSTTHETLKNESATFLELQTAHRQTVKELAQQKEKADRLENELTSLTNDKRLKWFLLGAGVLFVGIIIGFITKPQRRRSTLR